MDEVVCSGRSDYVEVAAQSAHDRLVGRRCIYLNKGEKMRVANVGAAVIACVLSAGYASASTISFTSRAAFNLAAGSLTNIDFEAFNTAPPFTFYGGTGLTTAGVSFTNPGNSYLFVADQGAVNPAYNWGSGASLLFGSNAEGSQFRITLPAGVRAFGFDFATEDDSNQNTGDIGSFSFVVDGVTTFLGTSLVRPNRAFFGVISDTPISFTDVNLNSAVGGIRPLGIIDNVEFGPGPVAAVPEPTTLLMLGAGLTLGVRRRRRLARGPQLGPR